MPTPNVNNRDALQIWRVPRSLKRRFRRRCRERRTTMRGAVLDFLRQYTDESKDGHA